MSQDSAPKPPDVMGFNSATPQTPDLQDKYYEWLISKCQNYETEGLSSLGSLFLSDVFVPLKVAANYNNNARSEMIPLRDYNIDAPKTIWDFLVAATGDNPTLKQSSIVVLGAPGSGKTTLLKHLAYAYAKKEQKKYFEEAPELIPVLLFIREVYQEIVDKQPDLVNFMAEKVKFEGVENQTSQSLSKWFAEKLKEKKCLIMLDGLDEVADEIQRSTVSNWIDQQIKLFNRNTENKSFEKNKNIFILTSRPRGYIDASLKNIGIVLEMQPVKIDQVRNFIHKWYLATETIRRAGDSGNSVEKQAKKQAEDLINRIRNSSPLAAMAVNPLLLTMISTVHHQLSLENRRLPERRVDLYKEMCEVLLEKRQKEKKINDKLINKNNKSVLQVLALKLMEQQESEFELIDGASWIQEPLEAVFSNIIQPKEFINYICNSIGLLVENELESYQFAHLSFQEYLAAYEIKKSKQEELLISNLRKSWWAETIRLYAAQSDATELIREILKIQSPSVDVMALAYDCLEESLRKVNEDVRRELLQRLEDGLKSTDPEIFKLAAQVSLIRRFRNFVRTSEELEIDNSYITCAEYQLFLDETGKSLQHQHLPSKRFLPGDAKKMITGISWENALRFCAWLGEWYRARLGNQLSEMAVHYRLPKKEENNDDRQFSESGIRLVKFQLPSRYSKLADYLWSGEWKKADEETATVMLQVSKKENENKGYLNRKDIENFPCDDLRIIDELWVYASKGHFGFSVQKNIYQTLDGFGTSKYKVWNDFGDHVGWRVKGSNWISYGELTFDTRSPKGHLPGSRGFSYSLLSHPSL